jgi:DNA-binding MarR family transcriptional regulator
MVINMDNILNKLQRYFLDTLDIRVSAERWEEAGQLPLFLRDMYEFYLISVLNGSFLLMIAKEQQEQTPAIVRKHLVQIQEKSGHEVVYLKESVSAYNRKRLIEHKVPFIIPGNQMYLPLLGIDLREHFRKQQAETLIFSPSTQAVVLYAIYHGEQEMFTPKDMAKNLGYSAMTMTRAFDELQQAGIGEHTVKGRERCLQFHDKGKALWEKVLQFMKTPVLKRLHVLLLQNKEPGIYAGLDALARYTMLANPKNRVYALSNTEWKKYRQQQNLTELQMPEPGSIQIEIWSYDPGMFADNMTADRLSLFLSLRDTNDERVESTLNEILEGMQW